MNKRQILASLNKIANELDNSRLYAEASTVTKVMKRLASDMDAFKKDPDGFMTDRIDLQSSDNLFEKYKANNNNNNVIDALNEAIQDMEDMVGISISEEELNRVIEIKNELERILN
jgi:hypothetical protein